MIKANGTKQCPTREGICEYEISETVNKELAKMDALEFAELMKNWMHIHANDENLAVGQIEYMFEAPICIFYNENNKILKTEYFEKKKEVTHQFALLNSIVKDVLTRILKNPNSKTSLKERKKLIENLYTEEERKIKKAYGAKAYTNAIVQIMYGTR